MQLVISSKKPNNFTLTLKRGKRIVDAVDFEFDKNLDTRLIQGIDFFIKRNKIDIFAFSRFVLGRGVDRKSSMYKILKAWLAGVAFASKS